LAETLPIADETCSLKDRVAITIIDQYSKILIR
jgi:hypothetical protein